MNLQVELYNVSRDYINEGNLMKYFRVILVVPTMKLFKAFLISMVFIMLGQYFAMKVIIVF